MPAFNELTKNIRANNKHKVECFICWFVLTLFTGLVILAQVGSSQTDASMTVERLLAVGEPAPGDQIFTGFGRLSINAHGDIAFLASTNSVSGLFLLSKGVVTALASTSTQVGETTLQFFVGDSSHEINDKQEVAFVAYDDINPRSGGIYISRNGQILPAVQIGDQVPGGGTFRGFGDIDFNNNGEIAFIGRLDDNRDGVFLWQDGTVHKIVIKGDETLDGGYFEGAGTPALNDVGTVIFDAASTHPDYGVIGVYAASGGIITPILRTYPCDPVTNSENFCDAVVFPRTINNNGEVVVWVSLPGIDRAISLLEAGTWRNIVQVGQSTPEGDTFGGFSEPALNSKGEVAFFGYVFEVPGRPGLYLYRSGSIINLSSTGEGQYLSYSKPAINSNTEVAFTYSSWDSGGLFLAYPIGLTRAGSNVSVPVASDVTVTFSQVTTSGMSSIVTNTSVPSVPSGFKLGEPATYYDITTTATYTSPVQVCIKYDEAQFMTNESDLRLLHFENGSFVDRTYSIDTLNNVICAEVESLSVFAVAQPFGIAPQLFLRDSGEPVTVQVSFQSAPGTAILKVDNGGLKDSEYEKVSSSVIFLNDLQVVGEHNFNQNVISLEVPVNLLGGNNILNVEIRGKPGGAIVITTN